MGRFLDDEHFLQDQGDNAVISPGASFWDRDGRQLLVSGGAVQLDAFGLYDFENERNLLATLGGPAGGTIYFSFVGQITNNTLWAGVELAQDGTADILLGANNGTVPSYWGWGDRDGGNGANSTISTEATAFLVYRLDFSRNNQHSGPVIREPQAERRTGDARRFGVVDQFPIRPSADRLRWPTRHRRGSQRDY